MRDLKLRRWTGRSRLDIVALDLVALNLAMFALSTVLVDPPHRDHPPPQLSARRQCARVRLFGFLRGPTEPHRDRPTPRKPVPGR